MMKKRFHQFVDVEKGPKNCAIIDFLKGNIYQIEKDYLEQFLSGQYDGIEDFIESMEGEELLIEIDIHDWVPEIPIEDNDDDAIKLEIQEGVDLSVLYDKCKGLKLSEVNYIGESMPRTSLFPNIKQIHLDFSDCIKAATVDGRFETISEDTYVFNHFYNSCWGKKIAITRDGKIRPCIHSKIIYGDLNIDDLNRVVESAQKHWLLTKDKVQKCQECELRYICFDCREIAIRAGGDIYSPNPLCNYNPQKGTWGNGDGA
jgi:radical SAM protein with 4Fe4S-binding SPASM domain